MGAVFTYLDSSGKTRGMKVNNWYSGIRRGHWGRYGAWVMMNIDPYWTSEAITDEELYAGDGYFYGWHIRWS
jgi:hypothetical protein